MIVEGTSATPIRGVLQITTAKTSKNGEDIIIKRT